MEETHIYDYPVDLNSDSAPARVIRMVGQGKRVLEIGAGPGSITKHLVKNNDVVALEIDQSAIPYLKKHVERVYSLDLNNEGWTDELLAGEEKFDIVIAADVLEHVYWPHKTLDGMKKVLKEGGEIILSLPHASHCCICACLLNEDFRYYDWGLLDRTHIRFFGLKNINALYEDAGMAIEHAEFVVRRPPETEFNDIWNSINDKAKEGLLTNPFAYVYQVVSRAKMSSFVANPIDLMTLTQIADGPKDADLSFANIENTSIAPAPMPRLRDLLSLYFANFVRGISGK